MSTRANLAPDHLIRKGWEVFRLRPWLCIAMFVLYSITQPGGGGGGGGGSLNDASSMGQAGAMLATAVLSGLALMTLVMLVLAGPIRGGYELAMLRMVRGDQSVLFADLFAGFSKFIKLFLTMLAITLLVCLGLLLCIVPGIIVMVGLWPAYLLVMEDDLDPIEALKAAWALTDGHKMNLFVLGLANFVLVIVGLLCCCVGVFVAGPVAQLAWMGAYDELRKASGAVAEPITVEAQSEVRGEPVDPTVGQPAPPALGPGDIHEAKDEEPTIDSPLEG